MFCCLDGTVVELKPLKSAELQSQQLEEHRSVSMSRFRYASRLIASAHRPTRLNSTVELGRVGRCKLATTVTVMLVSLTRRLIDRSAYMEIGTTNVSAIIGPYVQSVLTATQKFGIPYFAVDEPPDDHFRPYNLLTVRPRAADLYRLTVDVVRHYRWTSVAVLYDSPAGTLPESRSRGFLHDSLRRLGGHSIRRIWIRIP